MHRPQSAAESAPPVQLWLRTHGGQALVLAVLYFLFGHASFLVQVDDVLVTPVLFAPEGIALAMALRFGAGVWPGVFAGQLALALSLGLAPVPAVSISTINSLEAVLAVILFRAFKLDATLPRARDLAGLLLLIFLLLQPFSATFGNATLWASGIVDRAELSSSWLNWWIGNAFGQMLVTPLLLALLAGGRTKLQTAGDFLVPVLAISPVVWIADFLLRSTGVSSLLVVLAPILVLLALYRGLVAVCVGALAIAVSALYATSHAFGPFVVDGRANIPDLNLFIIGLALSGQFLAAFLRQANEQQKIADELREVRERLQRTAYELTENIPVGTYVLEFDEAGAPRFTFVSERFLAMTGLTREEVMANHAMALLPMSLPGREEIERINREVFTEKKRFFWEGEITVRGETRSVTLESVPRDRPGGGTLWEGVLTDITERKAAEEKIARSEAALRNALDTLPFAVGMCGASPSHADPEARIVFLNRNFFETYGYTLADLPTAAAWATKAYPDETCRREVFAWWDQAVQRLMAGQSVVETHESRAITKQGLPLDIVVSATMLEDKLVVSFLDITERKKAETQLQRVLDNLPIAVAATTLTSPAKLTFINEQFTRTFGYALQDVPTVAMWAEKAYPDAAYRREVFREWDAAVFRAIETKGSVESMGFEVTCKDGTKRDIIFRAVVLDDSLLISMTDVTERKKAERTLRSLREQIERTAFELTENIPVGTYTMVQPPHGGMAYFSFMSMRFLALTGLEREEARENPMNAFACVHPDDHEEWVRKNAYVFEHKLPFKEECRVIVDGETRWITAESTPRDLPDGSVVWEGVLTDITDRKLAEQKVAASEARLRKILDNIPIPVAINDATKDGRITFFNDAFSRTFGYTPDDVPDVGAWARLAYPDEDYRRTTFQKWDAAVAEAERTDGPVPPMEFRVHAKDGTTREVIINAVALEDMLLVGFVDITARKTAEQKLAAANRNMQMAASAAHLGFWELNVATGRDQWDEEMARINGIALADFDGRWEKFVHPDDYDEVMRETRRMLESENIFGMEYRIVRPDGAVRHVRERGFVVRDATGRAARVHGVLQDVTEENEAAQREKQLEEQHRRDLETKLKTSLTASAVAHEINQPLSAILLQSKMSLQQGEDQHEALRVIAQEAQRVVKTIDKMKTLLRSVQSNQHEIDLAEVTRSALLYNKGLMARRRITLRTAGLRRPCRITGDDEQLQLAITNLLRNASEAISEANKKKREIRVKLSASGDHADLVIGDSGPGWPDGGPAEVPLTTTKKAGTGIGLYVVRTAMENHRGEITFGRSPLGGAEVRLRFPRLV